MSTELRDVQRIGPALPAVRYEQCHVCHGTGWVEERLNRDGIGVGHSCAMCGGRGQITVEVTS